MTRNKNDHIDEANQILMSLGLPRAQHNERSALCLLALLNLTPGKTWAQAENPPVVSTPIMDRSREHYDKKYVADTPSHLIHFNGVRFLGPYNAL